MHQLIRAIVYAENEEEAIKRAKDVFDSLVEEGVFDYYATFDEDEYGDAKERWGERPSCVEADSDEGKRLIGEGLQYTKEEFMKHVAQIRGCLSRYSDEELFSEKDEEERIINATDFKYHSTCVGRRSGVDVLLYNYAGNGLLTEDAVKEALERYSHYFEWRGIRNPHEGDKVWVVPADAHY